MTLRPSHTLCRFLFCCATLAAFLGCGDTFRPVAGPLPQPGGDPGQTRNAIVVSDSAGTLAGGTTHIDVSGDSIASTHVAGTAPSFALFSGVRTFVANQGDDTLSVYQTFGGPGTTTTTISLAGGSITAACPVFMATTEPTNLYLAMSGCGNNANAGVAVVSQLTNTETGVITPNGGSMSVGVDPESLAELANHNEIYVANKGSNNVTVINEVDGSITNPNIAVGAAPSYVVASPDSACVYVANRGSDSISVISTASHAVTATVGLVPGSGPSFMVFDANLQRVYVANTGGNTITVLGHSAACTPSVLASAVAVGAGPVSIAPLADGTRVYVANQASSNVSVINASSFTVEHTIALPAGAAPVSIAASGDSLRVFTANSGAGNASIITTGNDQVETNISMPNQDPSCSSNCALQIPRQVIVTP